MWERLLRASRCHFSNLQCVYYWCIGFLSAERRSPNAYNRTDPTAPGANKEKLATVSHRHPPGSGRSIDRDGIIYAFHLYPTIPNISIVYLLLILALASTRGRDPAILAAVIAFLSFDFFLVPPLYTFVIARWEEWIALVVFLAKTERSAFGQMPLFVSSLSPYPPMRWRWRER